jgi:tetratricopeptide (TPR) repeat protein
VNDTALIEKYFSGELNSTELQAFEIRLQTDTNFAETFKLYSAIEKEMTTDDDEKELNENLSALTQKHFTKETPAKIIPLSPMRKKWWLYGSVAAASLALLFLFKPWQDKVLTNAEVYMQNAIPEELPSIVRGSNEDTLLIKATGFFNKKDYTTTIPLLEIITQQKPGEAQLQLSLGICYLQAGQYDAAINKFDSLANGQTTFKYDALLWKALVFLKKGKKKECISILKQVPPEAGNYKKAVKMIKDLSE